MISDETLIFHYTPAIKQQLIEWNHFKSPTKPTKFKHILSTYKIIAIIFWKRKVLLLIKFLPCGEINEDVYFATLTKNSGGQSETADGA